MSDLEIGALAFSALFFGVAFGRALSDRRFTFGLREGWRALRGALTMREGR